MLFLINSPIIAILFIVAGLIGFYFHSQMREEMWKCLKKSQFFHFFGAVLFSLFTSFLFGPLNYFLIGILLKYQNK
tara:strand:+ start:681 stop:908 length:228 start_codon:yes stop_codon:yes gene_type:complete